jgi:hypothetical protein
MTIAIANEAIPNLGMLVVIGKDGCLLNHGIAALHSVPPAKTAHCPCEAGVTMTSGTANDAIPSLGMLVVIGIDGRVLIDGIASLRSVPRAITAL